MDTDSVQPPEQPSLEELTRLSFELRGADLQQVSQEYLETTLRRFLGGWRAFGMGQDSSNVWFRARICPDAAGFANVFECIYPGADLVTGYGRANYPGEPTLYGAWTLPTAYAEVRARKGDFVHWIAVRLRQGATIPAYVIGEQEHIHCAKSSLVHSRASLYRLGASLARATEENRVRRVLIDAFFAEQFGKRAERSSDYRLTAAFAKVMLGPEGALMYPSALVRGGVNVAVSATVFDKLFEVVATAVIGVRQYFGSGIYLPIVHRKFVSFNADGSIDWDAPERVTFSFHEEFGEQITTDKPAWTVPPRTHL